MRRKKSINKHLPKLIRLLNLQDWEIEVIYETENCNDNSTVGMDNTISIPYLRSTIRCYPIMEDHTDNYIRDVLCHELCHIITEPMYSMCNANVNPHLQPFVEEMREQETERISRIALKPVDNSHCNREE
jgi:hypothetical protein